MTDSASCWGNDSKVSEFYAVLADEHCRQVIGFFQSESTDVATVFELAEHAVAPDDSSTDRRREAARLHHGTLPKLADADILEYDPRQQEVRYTGKADLESLLEQTHTVEALTD